MGPRLTHIGLGLLLAGCGGNSDSKRADQRPSELAGGECSILTVADIQAVTGVTVKPVPRGSSPGAGGTCANYVDADGHAYLGVNRLTSQAEYTGSVGAVPKDVYPSEQKLTSVGDEGVLFSGPGHIRTSLRAVGTPGS